MSQLDDFKQAFMEEATRGPDDITRAFYRQRDIENKDDDAIRMQKYFSEHPVLYRLNEILRPGNVNPAAQQAREEMGMGLKQSMAGKLGQLGGALSYDVLHDKTRNLYWLLNAAQAAGSVINELGVSAVNPDLFGSRAVRYPDGSTVPYENKIALSQIESELDGAPLAQPTNTKNPTLVANSNVRKGRDGEARLRNYRSGTVAALGVPAGFAINQGLGLMTPFGGYEGYEAVVPSDDDPTKTKNAVAEVAAKYFMGRTGNLLPYDEFKKVRPDVSKDEYMRYKAFKFDKEGDLNPFDDGQVTLPTGIIKATTEGIHGPEVQFLGRSLPVNTALIPFAGAVAGTMAGVKKRIPTEIKAQGKEAMDLYVDRNAGRRGLIGGTIGLAASSALGNLLEGERRRRNQAENEKQQQL
jgi:hypothetical protein